MASTKVTPCLRSFAAAFFFVPLEVAYDDGRHGLSRFHTSSAPSAVALCQKGSRHPYECAGARPELS